MTSSQKLLLESVYLPSGWASDVAVEISDSGDFKSIAALEDLKEESRSAYQRISGCVIPGIPNCHSHANQRAMSGLGEKAEIDPNTKGKTTDSFWTWRTVMYHYLEHIQPQYLYAIAQQLYLEMLKAGYTNVGEFQYLHHDQQGVAYSNPAEMTLQCMQGAWDLGIGFTALPVLYKYGGFGDENPTDGQNRFINDADEFCNLVGKLFEAMDGSENRNTSIGIAPHSLRAVSDVLLREVIDALAEKSLAAIHVHIAEQTKEVDDCLAWSRERPVEWLFNRFDVDKNWCLIHATHMSDEETKNLALSGAVAGLCPTTEANLGDGFFELTDFTDQGGTWAIGSDSHISISPVEELRWLEYGQRLLYKHRNIMATPKSLHTGMALLEFVLRGGAQCSGRKIGSIEPGNRADFLVLDNHHPRLHGRCESSLIDSWIFSGNENPVRDVYVGGKKVIDNGHHIIEETIGSEFRRAIDELAKA